MKFPRRLLFPAAVFSTFLTLSCATSPAAYQKVDEGVHTGNYAAALAAMETKQVKQEAYPAKNATLYRLDRGMIEHYAALSGEEEAAAAASSTASSADLEEAERLIEAAFTKSVSQSIASYIANDNTRDYAGEDYEDLYINVFNALNYYHRGDVEGSLVEIRRVNQKLDYLADKYQTAREKVVKSNKSLAGPAYTVEASKFSASALARYLGVLFHRASGRRDDARIDLAGLREAYRLAPAVYDNPLPSFLDDELDVPPGQGRLNVIAFTGLSPLKVEESTLIPIPLPSPNDWARLSLPKMVERPSAVTDIEIVLTGGQDGSQKIRLELLEDMGKVAQETFKARYSLILLKTVARVIVKAGASAAATKAVSERDSSGGIATLLFSVISKAAAEASEQADTRLSRYFPRYAYAGAVNLPPGTYSLRADFYSRGSLLASQRRENVQVNKDKLNLMEFVWLQ